MSLKCIAGYGHGYIFYVQMFFPPITEILLHHLILSTLIISPFIMKDQLDNTTLNSGTERIPPFANEYNNILVIH